MDYTQPSVVHMSEDAGVSATEATAASGAERATSDGWINSEFRSDSRGRGSGSGSDSCSGSGEAIPRVARHSEGRKKGHDDDDDDEDDPDLASKRVRTGIKGDGCGGSGSSGDSCGNGSIGGGRGGGSLFFPIGRVRGAWQ